MNLVRNATEERLVGEGAGLEIGCEDDEHIEGHLELPPGVERQKVDA